MNFGISVSLGVATLLLAMSVVSGERFTTKCDIRIERIMAYNRSAAKDEVGDFEDYVELFNHTQKTVTVGGMYLSDSNDNRRRWQIPAGTVIEANSKLRIWTDGEPEEGPLHANFRLNRSGERVMLFAADSNGNVLLDAVVFPRQLPNTAYVASR